MVCSWVVAMAEEEDSRTIVTDLYFNNVTYPEYGDTYGGYDVEVSLPNDAKYYIGNSGKLHLEKYDEVKGTWSRMETPYTVTEGKYRYNGQVRIAGTYGTAYRLPDDLKDANIYVNGVLCPQQSSPVTIEPEYSYGWFRTTEFEVTKVILPLKWTGGTHNLGTLYVGNAIVSFDLKASTVGGTESYSYSKKTNEIDWLNVTTDGILSGTPTAVCDKKTETITVTDGENSVDISVTFNAVYPNPNDRTIVTELSFSNFIQPTLGSAIDAASIANSMDKESFVRFGSNVKVYKYNEESNNWEVVENGTIADEGQYKFQAQIRIDNNNGHYYAFAKDLVKITVDGVEWASATNNTVGDDFSYAYISSPVINLSTKTGLKNLKSDVDVAAKKIVVDGKILIERNGEYYSIDGKKVNR